MRGEIIYSFPGASDPSSGIPFHLQMTGISRCDGSYRIARRPGVNFFVFEYIMKGKGHLEIDGRSFEPAAGDVYMIDGRLPHSYWSSANEPWVKIWFNVEGELVAKFIELYGLGGVHLFKSCPLEHIFLRGFETARDNPAKAQETGVLCVHELAIELSRRVERPWRKAEAIPSSMAKMKTRIDGDLSRTPSLEELCKLSGLSPSQTLRLFKKHFGTTPVQYSLERRIASAKLMLEGSAKSIKEIASDLGFADEYYFSNMFKSKTGSNPSSYRKLSR